MPSAFAVVRGHWPLLRSLVQRELQNRYAGSLMGMGWAFVQPLAMLAVYGVVFEYVFKARATAGGGDQPYIMFVATVLWPWLAFQEGVSRGVVAIQNHAAIVKKVSFPHELLAIATVTASFMVQLGGYALVMGLLALAGMPVALAAAPAVVVSLLSLYLQTLALVYALSALQVYLRDVEQVLAQVLSGLFYLTPILYTTAAVPAWLAQVMQWNPLVHVLEPLRSALLQTGQTDWWALGGILLASAFAVALGRRVFLRLAQFFEDVL